MRIGVLCPAEIAFRRFMPALSKDNYFEFAGVAAYSPKERFTSDELRNTDLVSNALDNEQSKAKKFVEKYGGKIFDGYESIISDPTIEAVYIPLPPAYHYLWGRKALEFDKHIFMEKPFCTTCDASLDLMKTAKKKGLAIHENYMFLYHEQLKEIKNIIDSGKIGDIRLYRLSFGFPKRNEGDFRYKRESGGGSVLDAGGYTIRLASWLLGEGKHIEAANLNFSEDYDVDLYGSGTLVDNKGLTVQIAFGMDNEYKCEMEAWGSKGYLRTGRIFTAPEGYIPILEITCNNVHEEIRLSKDDSFYKSLQIFKFCIKDSDFRKNNYQNITKQSNLLSEFLSKARVYR